MPRLRTTSATISRTTLGLLWATAAASVVGAVVATLGPALAAAPAYDLVVPTKDPATGAVSYDPLCTAASICRTDNTTVTYYMDRYDDYKVSAAGQTQAVQPMNAWADNTVLTAVYDTDPTFSGAGETDVTWREFAFTDDTLGETTCQDRVDGTRNVCDGFYIEITPYGGWNARVARHEAGHAFGLVHGAQSAPVQGQCAERLAIMRAALSCTDDATLGSLPKANVNHVY